MPYTFTSTSFLSYVTTNANNNFLLACVTTVDNTQIGGAGLYASQIIPTSVGQATFGGSQTYTFPAAISVGNGASFGATITTAGISDSGGISSTTGNFSSTLGVTGASTLHGVSATTGSFSSTLGVTGATTLTGALAANGGLSSTTGAFSSTVSNAGSTSTGALQQTVSGTTYTVPYDAQSTAGNTNTHIEHGSVTTGTFSAGFACAASRTFAKAFTAQPEIFLSPSTSNSGYLYVNTESTTAFTPCSFISGASSGTVLIHWMAIGE